MRSCLDQLRLANAAGPKMAYVGHPPDQDYANGSLADDCAAIVCLLRSGKPFLLGRPSMGSEIRAAHAAYVLGARNMSSDPDLAKVAGVVESKDATARDFGMEYGAAIALSDLAGKLHESRLSHTF